MSIFCEKMRMCANKISEKRAHPWVPHRYSKTWSALVLLKFCWRTHIVSLFTEGARFLSFQNSLSLTVISRLLLMFLVTWTSSLLSRKLKTLNFHPNEHIPGNLSILAESEEILGESGNGRGKLDQFFF